MYKEILKTYKMLLIVWTAYVEDLLTPLDRPKASLPLPLPQNSLLHPPPHTISFTSRHPYAWFNSLYKLLVTSFKKNSFSNQTAAGLKIEIETYAHWRFVQIVLKYLFVIVLQKLSEINHQIVTVMYFGFIYIVD